MKTYTFRNDAPNVVTLNFSYNPVIPNNAVTSQGLQAGATWDFQIDAGYPGTVAVTILGGVFEGGQNPLLIPAAPPGTYAIKEPKPIEGGGGGDPPAPTMGRSVLGTVVNDTALTLTLVKKSLDRGRWTTKPPATIPPDGKGKFLAEASTSLTGVEGKVFYRGGPGTDFKMYFNNPFIGSNSYNKKVPAGYKIKRKGGGGDNAKVKFIISPA